MQKPTIFTCIMQPSIQEVKIYFCQRGMPDLEADHFFEFYEKKQWKSKSGLFRKNWKNIARTWIMSVLIVKPWLFNKNIH
jgi:hypothetical protein